MYQQNIWGVASLFVAINTRQIAHSRRSGDFLKWWDSRNTSIMATMDDHDDMKVRPYSVPEASVDFSSWPLSEDEESKGLFNTSWTQAIKDFLRKFLHSEDPYSVKADEDGIELARDFLIKNADLSAAINKKKEDLIHKSGVREVKVTYFKNWGDTRQGLYLYVCPTEIDEVKDLVKACEHLDIKVGFP